MNKKVVSIVLAIIFAAIIIFIEGGIILKTYKAKHTNNVAVTATVAGNISSATSTNKQEF